MGGKVAFRTPRRFEWASCDYTLLRGSCRRPPGTLTTPMRPIKKPAYATEATKPCAKSRRSNPISRGPRTARNRLPEASNRLCDAPRDWARLPRTNPIRWRCPGPSRASIGAARKKTVTVVAESRLAKYQRSNPIPREPEAVPGRLLGAAEGISDASRKRAGFERPRPILRGPSNREGSGRSGNGRGRWRRRRRRRAARGARAGGVPSGSRAASALWVPGRIRSTSS